MEDIPTNIFQKFKVNIMQTNYIFLFFADGWRRAYYCSQSDCSAGVRIGPAPGVVGPSVSGGVYL